MNPKRMSDEALRELSMHVGAALGLGAAEEMEGHIAALEQELADARKEREELTSKAAQLEATNRRLNALTLHDADGRLMTQGALNALFSQYHTAGDVLGEVIGLRNVHPGQGETPVIPPLHAASRAMWETVQERDAERAMRIRAEELANANADKANAALADNAALLSVLSRFPCEAFPQHPAMRCEPCRVKESPHPGTALLEDLVNARKERDWARKEQHRHATERDEYAARVATLERKAGEVTSALLEEHRKALALLDRVHPGVRELISEHDTTHRLHWSVRCITCAPRNARERAMKEPEQ